MRTVLGVDQFGLVLAVLAAWHFTTGKIEFDGFRVEIVTDPERVAVGGCDIHAVVGPARKGPALGAQAGEARLREVMTSAGFSRFRRATETPFNLVLEA